MNKILLIGLLFIYGSVLGQNKDSVIKCTYCDPNVKTLPIFAKPPEKGCLTFVTEKSDSGYLSAKDWQLFNKQVGSHPITIAQPIKVARKCRRKQRRVK